VSGSGFLDLLTLPGCWQWGGPLGCLNPYISECGCGRPEDGGSDVAAVVAGVNISNIEQQQQQQQQKHVRGLDFGPRLRLCRRTYNNHLT